MRNERIRIVIADDEQNICEMLKRLIRFDDLGLELIGMVSNGEDLRNVIVKEKPDIVITDIHMPVMDGLEVIRWCNENGCKTNFIVLSGYHQFEYAYNALKYKVNDYLLKPLNEDELNETLERIAKGIREGEQKKDNSAYIQSLHEHFMKTVSYYRNGQKPVYDNVDMVNQEFMLKAEPGIFRFLFICVDDLRKDKQGNEQLNSVIEKLKDLAEKKMSHCCFEYVCRARTRSMKIFLNYPSDQEDEVESELKRLYEEAQGLADLFNGMNITVCIGDSMNDPKEIPAAARSAWYTMFCRFGIGTNRLIWYGQLRRADISAQKKEWETQIRHAWDVLDEEMFANTIYDIFSVPRSGRDNKDFAEFVHEIGAIAEEGKESFFQKTGLEAPEDREVSPNSRLDDSDSMEEYRDSLISLYGAQIRECSEMADKKNLKPIRLACSYVESHYNEPIKLEDVAKVVNLNPIYYSTLFARKTGQNFTEYVTLFKLKKACELLADSDMNINEIADSLGFTDARYFSKLFRKKMGLKPTEYRRIYG